MKSVLTIFFLLCSVLYSFSQEYPVYNQYFNNPFLINAAYVGSSGFTEVTATHRRQWIGIENAPVSTALTFQYPTKKNVSLGLGLFSSSRAILNKSSVMATVGYKVELGTEHTLRFGLSAGMGNYKLNLKGINEEGLNDLAVGRMLGANYFYDGQFGVTYSNRGLTVGFAIPNILNSGKFNDAKVNNVSFNELKFNLLSASYRIGKANSSFSIEPYLLYRMGYEVKEQWEGLATVYYKNIFWFGGSYRQKYGPTAFIGVEVKGLKFGYSYEIPLSSLSKYSKGSHEIQLNFRFGKNRQVIAPKKESPAKTEASLAVVAEQKETQVEKEEISKESAETLNSEQKVDEQEKVEPEKINVQNPKVAPITKANIKPYSSDDKSIEENRKEKPGSEVKVELKKSNNPMELKKNNYLVVGVFSSVKNAENFKRQLKSQGHVTFMGYSSKTRNYYVYLSKYADIEDARHERTGVREMDLFNNAWLMTVE